MADDLIDIGKFKVTRRTAALLEQRIRLNPKLSKQAVARQLLHEIALREYRAAKLLLRLSPDEESSGEVEGT